MTERRKKSRGRPHPLAKHAKLKPRGPALERRSTARARSTAKERLTVQLGPEILNRLRNAVFWTPGMTITGFIEQCIQRTVDQMENDRGSEFPKRSGPLKTGRPPR